MEKPAEFVDLERYPITSLESARGRALVSDIQNRMAASCICALPGFLRPEALVRMVAEAEALEPMSHSGPTEASPYFFNMEPPVNSMLCRRTIRGSERRRATCGRSPAISFRRARRLCCSITGTGLPGFSPLRRAHGASIARPIAFRHSISR